VVIDKLRRRSCKAEDFLHFFSLQALHKMHKYEHVYGIQNVGRQWAAGDGGFSTPCGSTATSSVLMAPRSGPRFMWSSSKWVSVLLLAAASFCTSAKATQRDEVCLGLKPNASPLGDLFVSVDGTTILNYTDSRLALGDLKGKQVTLFYTIRRVRSEWPTARTVPGALSLKYEAWDPNGNNIVYLSNNRWLTNPPRSSCPNPDFETYQSFHRNGGIDKCLASVFHNQSGEFPTLAARELFLFPDDQTGRRPFWNFFGPPVGGPVKRQSLLFNYKIKPQTEATCIRMNVTVTRETTAVRFLIHDLTENRFGERAPRILLELR
jgi:hypothetical protein